jgi:hypothetical protein
VSVGFVTSTETAAVSPAETTAGARRSLLTKRPASVAGSSDVESPNAASTTPSSKPTTVAGGTFASVSTVPLSIVSTLPSRTAYGASVPPSTFASETAPS